MLIPGACYFNISPFERVNGLTLRALPVFYRELYLTPHATNHVNHS